MLRTSLRFLPISFLALALALIVTSTSTPPAAPSQPEVAPGTSPCPACGAAPLFLFPWLLFEIPLEWTFA